MFSRRSGLSLLFVLFLFVGFISASPLPAAKVPAKAPAKAPTKGAPASKSAHGKAAPKCPARLHKRGQKVFLGYNGFNGTPRQPQASGGGELGAVFYIADSVDLAKSFARGVDPSKNYVCMVYADGDAWAHQPKVWVSNSQIAAGSRAMDRTYPGAVLFAGHTAAGLPTGSPGQVYQMGVRQAQISRLGLTVECYEKSCFDGDHHTMNYAGLIHSWGIQR